MATLWGVWGPPSLLFFVFFWLGHSDLCHSFWQLFWCYKQARSGLNWYIELWRRTIALSCKPMFTGFFLHSHLLWQLTQPCHPYTSMAHPHSHTDSHANPPPYPHHLPHPVNTPVYGVFLFLSSGNKPPASHAQYVHATTKWPDWWPWQCPTIPTPMSPTWKLLKSTWIGGEPFHAGVFGVIFYQNLESPKFHSGGQHLMCQEPYISPPSHTAPHHQRTTTKLLCFFHQSVRKPFPSPSSALLYP